MNKDKIINAFNQWGKRMKGGLIKVIYKSCWKLKYCPYESFVESFLLLEDEEYNCNIFGHQSPVVRIAEPFT